MISSIATSFQMDRKEFVCCYYKRHKLLNNLYSIPLLLALSDISPCYYETILEGFFCFFPHHLIKRGLKKTCLKELINSTNEPEELDLWKRAAASACQESGRSGSQTETHMKAFSPAAGWSLPQRWPRHRGGGRKGERPRLTSIRKGLTWRCTHNKVKADDKV